MRKIILAAFCALWFTPALAHGMLLHGMGRSTQAAGGGCATATTYLGRVSVDGAHQTAYTNMICAMVSDGVWAHFDAFYIFATQDATTALINLPNATYAATANGSPTFTADRGYTTAATKSVDTGFLLSGGTNFVQNSAAIAVWNGTTGQGTAAIIQAGTTFGGNDQMIPRNTGDFAQGAINDSLSSQASTSSIVNGSGLTVLNRPNSSTKQFFHNGSQLGTDLSRTSTAPSAFNLTTAGQNSNAGVYVVRAVAAMSACDATCESNFYTDLGTYMTAVGANP